MKNHQVSKNQFIWSQKDKPTPLLWLFNSGNDLFLVNNSNGTLDQVVASSGGFTSSGDDTLSVSSSEDYRYSDIAHGWAVKVDEYDDYYDLDYVIRVYLKVASRELGCLEIESPANKGGVKDCVLLWCLDEVGKHVNVKQCDKAS